jgi:hypothetical protein
MNKLLAVTSVATLLVGCASGPSNYQLYAETQKAIAQAQSQAEIARYLALSEIAKGDDSVAKVAAVMSLQMGSQTTNRQQQVAPPRSMSDTLINWATILVPSAVQLYGINQNTQLGLRQSDNSTRLGLSTNQSFVDMAKEINDPTIVTQPAPTIVTQPAPTIVTQPAPTIVTQPAPTIVKPEVVNPVVVDPVIVQPGIQ